MNAFEKLTRLQEEIGYQNGRLNAIALLGLMGESGEVLDLIDINYETELGLAIEQSIKAAAIVDRCKKQIRDLGIEANPKIKDGCEKDFDTEIGDVVYYLNALALARGKTLEEYAEISFQKVSAKIKRQTPQ